MNSVNILITDDTGKILLDLKNIDAVHVISTREGDVSISHTMYGDDTDKFLEIAKFVQVSRAHITQLLKNNTKLNKFIKKHKCREKQLCNALSKQVFIKHDGFKPPFEEFDNHGG